MKRTTTDDRRAPPLASRLAWFIGIWAVSVAVLSGIAYALHKVILG